MVDRRTIRGHRRGCEAFGAAVDAVNDRWDQPTPCTEWDARDVLEHVIGFHEVLVLRPLGINAHRPKDDIPGRWNATQAAIFAAIEADSDGTVELDRLLPSLTTDVLVHTWDLGKAIGLDPVLDPELCETSLAGVQLSEAAIRQSGLYREPVALPACADPQARLLALLGRDPAWLAPR